MKDRPVIKPGFRQLNKILNMLGSQIGIKLHFNLTKLRLDNGFRPEIRRRRNCLHLALPHNP